MKKLDDMYVGEQGELFGNSWAINEGFKSLQEKLDELIPCEGSVEFARSKNKNLEKFRVAQNLIYDLFNNGLMNRGSHFRQFFGFGVYTRGGISQNYFQQLEKTLEPIVTDIMLKAAKEQFSSKEEVNV